MYTLKKLNFLDVYIICVSTYKYYSLIVKFNIEKIDILFIILILIDNNSDWIYSYLDEMENESIIFFYPDMFKSQMYNAVSDLRNL